MLKKKLLSKLCATIILLALLLLAIFLGINIQFETAYADNKDINQICKEFTDSDDLVDLDGGLAEINIRDFKDKLKKVGMNLGTEMPELAQIIPSQFLQKEDTDKEYYYFGQEYGFMVIHEGNA